MKEQTEAAKDKIAIVFLNRESGSVAKAICEENNVDFFDDSDLILPDSYAKVYYFGPQESAPGFDCEKHYSILKFEEIDIERHLSHSDIGHFFSAFGISESVDPFILAASIHELAPGRGYFDKITDLKNEYFKGYMESFLASEYGEDAIAEIQMMEPYVRCHEIANGITDLRDHPFDDGLIYEAAVYHGYAFIWSNWSTKKTGMSGPCEEWGFDWFKDYCFDAGYSGYEQSYSRQEAEATLP